MKSKESNILFRFKFAEIDITANLVFPGRMQELLFRKKEEIVKDTKKVHTSRQGVAGFSSQEENQTRGSQNF